MLVEETLGGTRGLGLQEKGRIKGMCGGVFFFIALLIARESIKDIGYYFE